MKGCVLCVKAFVVTGATVVVLGQQNRGRRAVWSNFFAFHRGPGFFLRGLCRSFVLFFGNEYQSYRHLRLRGTDTTINYLARVVAVVCLFFFPSLESENQCGPHLCTSTRGVFAFCKNEEPQVDGNSTTINTEFCIACL